MNFHSLLKREISKQFYKFVLIGLESTILNYLIFIVLLYFFSVNYLISAGSGFVSGVFLGYVFNKIYTFGSKRKHTIAFPIYLLVYSFSLTFTLLSLTILVEFLGLIPIISNLMVLPITASINFFGVKILAFKNLKW